MSDTDLVMERISRSQSSMPGVLQDHVHFDDRGSIDSIKCKICGTVIAGKIIDDRPPTEMVIGGKKQLAVHVTFARFDNYKEATILFADGSSHITHLCKSCLNGFLALSDNEERARIAEAVYCADLYVWMKETSFIGGGHIHPRNAAREVLDMQETADSNSTVAKGA